MTGTLATVNGEHYAVPGLTFWGQRTDWGGDVRIALVCFDGRGAVEVWTVEAWMHSSRALYRGLGGVEIHSPAPHYDGDEPIEGCTVLDVPCYTDGSSLAYGEQFLPLIEAGDSEAVLRLLAEWHASHFGPAEAAQP